MKLPEYLSPLPAELEPYRPRFRELAGKLDSDTLFYLAGYLASVFASYVSGKVSDTVVVSVSGAQGTGKSTMTRLAATLLSECFGISTAILSLDDFYLPLASRRELARNVHPLLAVRGVPGTHDLALLNDALLGLRQGQSVESPVFDKAEDDRAGDWRMTGPANVILCEGWCWGAAPEPGERLGYAINELERSQDIEGVWRRYVNDQITRYQAVFRSDCQVFFKAPSLDAVIRWRYQQEVDLAAKGGGSKVMTEAEIKTFVSYYERITRWMMEEMPDRANITVALDDSHLVKEVLLG